MNAMMPVIPRSGSRKVNGYVKAVLALDAVRRTRELPPAQWHDYLADATLADSICDRLLHNAHRIVLQGPSRRKEAKLDH